MNWPAIVLHDTWDWPQFAAIPIDECGAPLAKLPAHPRLRGESVYFAQGLAGSSAEIYLRPQLNERLLVALSHIPEGLGLLVLDGWRSIATQHALRQSVLQQIQQDQPNLSEDEYQHILNQFVADPNRATMPLPHNTGGSVDVALFDSATGNRVDMGSAFDEASPLSYTTAFENQAQTAAHTHRRILFHAMTRAGFTNLPSEWWHYDYGNQLWAFFAQQPQAIFHSTAHQAT